MAVSVSQSGNFLTPGQSGNRVVSLAANTTSTTLTVQTENDATVESPGTVFATVVGSASYFASSPNSATVRVLDDGPPGQPVNLTALEDDEQVALSWTAAPTGDAPVLDYSYRVRRSDISTWDPDCTLMFGSGLGTRGYTVYNLTNGLEYIIQVRARRATGDGVAAEVTANLKDEPDAPEVTVESRNESLLVTWSVSDDGGQPTTDYRVQWKSGSESFDASRQAETPVREYTIPNLTNGTEYRVRVQVKNEVGWGGWSIEQRGTPTPRLATSLRITTDGRKDTGDSGGHGRDERALGKEVAEWTVAVGDETEAPVAHSPRSLRRGVEEEIEPLLRGDPKGRLKATTIIEWLEEHHPGRFSASQLRTLQRRLQDWRALHGPDREVYFPQEHPRGREAQIDFTHGNSLGVTIEDGHATVRAGSMTAWEGRQGTGCLRRGDSPATPGTIPRTHS